MAFSSPMCCCDRSPVFQMISLFRRFLASREFFLHMGNSKDLDFITEVILHQRCEYSAYRRFTRDCLQGGGYPYTLHNIMKSTQTRVRRGLYDIFTGIGRVYGSNRERGILPATCSSSRSSSKAPPPRLSGLFVAGTPLYSIPNSRCTLATSGLTSTPVSSRIMRGLLATVRFW